MITHIRKAVVPFLVLLAGAGTVAILNATKPEPESATEPPRALKVFTERAVRESAQLMVETNGEVRATVRSEIAAQVGGRVVSVSPEFVEGGRVTAGEPLLVIEDTDYQFALDEAEARLAAAQVDLEQSLADADVARKQLAGQANPSPLALKKPQVARARAAVEAAEANLALARTNLERTRISLPYEGRIATTSVDLGQYVSPGQLVGSGFSTERVEIRLPLNDSQLGALGVPIGYAAGESLGLPVDLAASVAGERYRWSGRLTRVDAAIDPTTRVIYATAEVRDPYRIDAEVGGMPLAVGLFVKAVVSGRIVENAIGIPSRGLRAGNRVFVLTDEGQLDIRNVDVIYGNGDRTVLAAGVEAGEQVIISAIRNPIPGMRLEVIDPQQQSMGAREEREAQAALAG